jgi:GNAT superfamily N-acetyltransferase
MYLDSVPGSAENVVAALAYAMSDSIRLSLSARPRDQAAPGMPPVRLRRVRTRPDGERAMVTIERVDTTMQTDAVGLLALQFEEHRIRLSPQRLEHAVAGLIGAGRFGAMLLAREGERAVGLAALSYIWTLEHGGMAAWLDELYVVPERRGHGVGSALLERAASVALDAGCITIDLEVDHEHARVETLYQRTGFERLPRSRWVRRLSPGKVGASYSD